MFLALVAVTQFAIEVGSSPRVLTHGVRAEPLFAGSFLLERGPRTFVVKSLSPSSPLVAAGVLPGDRLRYDAPLGRWYNVVADDKVSLTVQHDAQSRRIEVTVRNAGSMPRYQVATYAVTRARQTPRGGHRL